MKVCAHNPAQPEYSLCGDAFDLEADLGEGEPYVLATDTQMPVTCSACKRVLADLFSTYTPTGRLK